MCSRDFCTTRKLSRTEHTDGRTDRPVHRTQSKINRKHMMSAQLALEPNQVYTFKMNSGEEMVAKVKQSGGDWIVLEEPVSIAPGPQGMGLIPSLFTADPKEEIRLNTNSISLVSKTDDSVRMKYIEATTGIKVPEKRLILG